MDTEIDYQDVLVRDEVNISVSHIASVWVFGAQRPTPLTLTFHGVVAAADESALDVLIDPSRHATRIPRVDITHIELAGLNGHRPVHRS